MFIIPILLLEAPEDPLRLVPPVQFPVILTVPPAAFCIPCALVLWPPPVQFPVKLTVPVEEFKQATPAELAVLPVELPIMLTVPVDALFTAFPAAPDALKRFAIIVQDCPVVKLEVIAGGLPIAPHMTPLADVQVRVIPLVGTKVPPAVVTPVAVPF
jgi:hypothetical protein